MSDANIWSDEWEGGEGSADGGVLGKRLPRGRNLGASVYELEPGDRAVYHFHHGAEELLVVLRGRPTLRTGGGERRLAEGEAVYFPTGPEGAHGVANDTAEPVRYLMASTLPFPEVIEYPDEGQITAQARTASQTGDQLWLVHDLREEAR